MQGTMHIPTKMTMAEKVTLSFDIQPTIDEHLSSKAKERGESKQSLIDSIITEYLYAYDQPNKPRHEQNSRKYFRHDVSIPAFIEMKMPSNETQCKPASITNISCGGIALTIDCKSSMVIDNLYLKLPFSATFSIPSVPEIIKILCKPVHITKNTAAEIGASFFNIPLALKSVLQTQYGL